MIMIKTLSDQAIARTAGLLYLGVVLTGIFSLMYVPSKLIAADNAMETCRNIKAFETLFRSGILAGILCYIFFLFLSPVLYRLLKPVNGDLAKLMALLAILSVPVYFINVQNLFSVLSVIKEGTRLGLSAEQIQVQAMLYLDQYGNGMRMVHIFSGLWLFPLGLLIFKSGFLPKILGVLLMLGCFGYLINFTGHAMIENYSEMGVSSYISLPASIGEIGTCFWLLIMGIKDRADSKAS